VNASYQREEIKESSRKFDVTYNFIDEQCLPNTSANPEKHQLPA